MSNDILKKGADYLLKGGTLLSESCQICNGLLIKFKGNIICLNCQRAANLPDSKIEKAFDKNSEEKKIDTNQKSLVNNHVNKNNDSREIEPYKDILLQIEKTIIKKIIESNESIKIENDLYKQKNNLRILLLYLKILKKSKTIY
jgi:UPF0148 protein